MAADRASPPEGGSFFDALGVPARFQQDAGALEGRFYELSRELHPDRFAAGGAEALKRSLERMSLLNKAYGVLKDVSKRREYLLELHGVKVSDQVPVELAEAWFDLQDAVAEDRVAARARVESFRAELERILRAEEAEIRRLEAVFDAGGAQAVLERIAAKLRVVTYIRSLERDIISKGIVK